MFPGNRESKGIFANKIINIGIPIRMQLVINKGVSIFIINYIIQDEVVNGNVPNPTYPPKNILIQISQRTQSFIYFIANRIPKNFVYNMLDMRINHCAIAAFNKN
jgi:hypothetical protein